MKKLLIFLIFFSNFSFSQTLVEYDYMETSSPLYLSAGWWTPALTAGWFNNASVTPTLSAVIYGSGSGTSGNEQDWYSMPNKTGLNPAKQYQLKFRLASYTFSNSTATTRGVDIADIVDVQISTNGGVSYITELRITGNSNARWDYNATGTITHTANGSFTNSAAPTGDVYQSPAGVTTAGPSTVTLNLPTGISQVAIDIFCRANSAGEEWWIDNVELWDATPISLPVELIYFDGTKYPTSNILKWATASEQNSSHFTIERSIDGENWREVGTKTSAGNSTEKITYSHSDNINEFVLHYYRLVQYDIDGQFKVYGPIALDNSNGFKRVIKCINTLGQEVGLEYKGVVFEIYEDGTSKKTIR